MNNDENIYIKNKGITAEFIDEGNEDEAKGIYREFKKWRRKTYDLTAPGFMKIVRGGCIPSGSRQNSFKFTLIRTNSGEAAGLLIINENWPEAGTLFIGMMYIKESMRGNGIGKEILDSLDEFAGSEYNRMMIRVHQSDKTKPEFFLKNGFQTAQILFRNDQILERTIH